MPYVSASALLQGLVASSGSGSCDWGTIPLDWQAPLQLRIFKGTAEGLGHSTGSRTVEFTKQLLNHPANLTCASMDLARFEIWRLAFDHKFVSSQLDRVRVDTEAL